MISMEPVVVDLDADKGPKVTLATASPKVTASLGEGVELLMNGKRKAASEENASKPTPIKDLASLEKELNDLSDKPSSSSTLR